jgi:anti-sigma factor RsiW
MNLHEDLKAYLDGQLDPFRMAEVEAALSEDATLREELAAIQRLSASIRLAAPPLEPTKGLEETLAALTRPATGRWGKAVAWSTGLAASLAAGLFISQELNRPSVSKTTVQLSVVAPRSPVVQPFVRATREAYAPEVRQPVRPRLRPRRSHRGPAVVARIVAPTPVEKPWKDVPKTPLAMVAGGADGKKTKDYVLRISLGQRDLFLTYIRRPEGSRLPYPGHPDGIPLTEELKADILRQAEAQKASRYLVVTLPGIEQGQNLPCWSH